ncbi:MAG TPA: ankyrin repeat domain-containing protein [Xanthobacteraceae bacterium]|nr:ankyrin repeat domain-containing protein [Xanthobacteraceae bacterium]
MTDTSRKADAQRFIEPLPPKPNLDKQRKRAKSLALDYWRGDADAIARVQVLHPKPPTPEEFKLADAQLVIARGHGFESWARLRHKIDALTKSPVELFIAAVHNGDVDDVRDLIKAHPDLAGRINEPLFDFQQPAIHIARGNVAMLDLLIAHGADINAKSTWEMGGFGILETATPEQLPVLLERGAAIDVWSAARFGMADRLRALLTSDPSLVNAKGGDGKRPLHYAANVEIAQILLDHGAEIDALCDDHLSSAAQYLVSEHPDVARFLIARGARSDILLAAALGDVDRVRRHLDEDPDSVRMRVSQDWFPMVDTAKNGGHIYQWTLGFHVSAFDVARKHGHRAVLDLLLARTSPLDRLLDALWNGDLAAADAILAASPKLIEQAPPNATRLVADAARNNKTAAVDAMLARGFPVTATSQHGATPFHWAAWHGNPDMLRSVLKHNPPLDMRDRDQGGTAIGWLIHGATGGWKGIATDRHAECAPLLLEAGLTVDEATLPTGHDALDRVLREWFVKQRR